MAFQDMFSNFKQDIGGLLDPNKPENLTALTNSPMFNVGMGILSANQDPTKNVYQGAMQGLGRAKQQTQSDEDRKRNEKLRMELAELIRRLKSQGQMPGAAQLPGATPGITPQPRGLDPISQQMYQRWQLQDIVGRQHG
jgi:hypothetical protein